MFRRFEGMPFNAISRESNKETIIVSAVRRKRAPPILNQFVEEGEDAVTELFSGINLSSNQPNEDMELPCEEDEADCTLRSLEFYSEGDEFQFTTETKNEMYLSLPLLPSSQSQVLCVSCGNLLNFMLSTQCFRCRWPVCRDWECNLASQASQHSTMECTALSQANLIPQSGCPDPYLYKYLWLVRLVLFKESKLPFSSFDEVLHVKEDISSSANLIEIFSRKFKSLRSKVSESELIKLCVIVARNSSRSECCPEDTYTLVLNNAFCHSCSPNLTRRGDFPNRLIVAKPIQPGEILTVSYDPQGVFCITAERRQRLICLFNFECRCERCTDHTEFNTYFSRFPCTTTKCKDDEISQPDPELHIDVWQPKHFLSLRSPLKCDFCFVELRDGKVEYKDEFQIRLKRTRDCEVYFEVFLREENRERKLHVTNYMYFAASWIYLDKMFHQITDKRFLDEGTYKGLIFPCESVQYVVKKLHPMVFSTRIPVFRVILLVKLAYLTDDLKCKYIVSLNEVEDHLNSLYFGREKMEYPLDDMLKKVVEANFDENSFDFVEQHGIQMFIDMLRQIIERKTRVCGLRRKNLSYESRRCT